MLLLLSLGAVLISFLTGCIAIALVSLYDQADAVLIIIACSTFVYAFAILYKIIFKLRENNLFLNAMNLFLQLLTFGSSVEYFNYSVKHSIILQTPLHQRLIIALDTSLLFHLFVNGILFGYSERFLEQKSLHDEEQNYESNNSDSNVQYVPDDKFIPMKDSAQTLTPDLSAFLNNPMNTNNHIINNEKKNAGFNQRSNHNSNSNNIQNNKIPNNKNKQNIEWMLQQLHSTSHDTEETSTSSVVKHKLGVTITPTSSSTPTSIHSRLRSLSSVSASKKLTSFKFKSKMLRFGLSNKISRAQVGKPPATQQPKKEINLNTKYLTRLSTISDLPKSFVNLLNSQSSNNLPNDKHFSIIETEEEHVSNEFVNIQHNESPQLQRERVAIERINNALLPPCLHAPTKTPTPQPVESFTTMRKSPLLPYSDDDLERQENIINELGNFSPSASIGLTEEEPRMHDAEYPANITLEMWQNQKKEYLKMANETQNSTLLSPFQFNSSINNINNINENINNKQIYSISESPGMETKKHFNFPVETIEGEDKKDSIEHEKVRLKIVNDTTLEKLNRINDNSMADTISELDEYLNEFEKSTKDETQVLEESLQQHDYSTSHIVLSECVSKEYTRSITRHSPTKSLVSIISGNGSLHKQKSSSNFLNGNTQVGGQFPHIYGTGNNSISMQSSPTKQRFKSIGKKLSLSNLSDNFTVGPNELCPESASHSRGKSIDFSYIHQIQNKHSPSKSISGISMTSSSHSQNNHLKFKKFSNGLDLEHNNFTTNDLIDCYYQGSRRNSCIGKVSKKRNSIFYKHQNNTLTFNPGDGDIHGANTTVTEQEVAPHEERKVSNQESVGSDNLYPDMVVSEYDREKWNAMRYLNIVDDQGELNNSRLNDIVTSPTA